MGSSQSKTLFRRVQARQLPIGLVPSEPAYVSIQCDPIGGHMAKLETILLVGGGMAGLTTATALHQHGFTVELVERRETRQAVGPASSSTPTPCACWRRLALPRASSKLAPWSIVGSSVMSKVRCYRTPISKCRGTMPAPALASNGRSCKARALPARHRGQV